jgi:UDP-N-acetylmuramate: L-alanyl-gamma-D-glutamyl-meso-diaminopimelate ligase
MKLHLIGICGTGMGAVAGLLKEAGHDVRGSDAEVYPPMSDQLRALGVPVFVGYRADNLDWGPDQVVVGNVCRADHVEVTAAKARGIPLTSFPAVLEELFLPHRRSVVVAGTHGKTTTTALLAVILVDAGRDPSFLIGGVPRNFDRGYRLGAGPSFLVEGDEYDTTFFDKGSKFLHYRPQVAVLTSVELDHVDIFPSFEAVKAAFAGLVALVPEDGLLLVAASSPDALAVADDARCLVETYAVGKRGAREPMWHADIVDGGNAARTQFVVRRAGEVFGRFDVALSGEANVENALAAIAAASALGLAPEEIERAVRRFIGVKRRQEVVGVAAGVTVIDDYGHHPTAVRATIAALRRRTGKGKLVAIFEPRTATSRRSTFQSEFAEAFALADEVVVGKLHAPDGIPPGERLDPERLAADVRGRGTAARYVPEVDAIVAHVTERVSAGDCVVVFSSGAFGGIHRRLLDALGDPIVPARPDDMARVREILTTTGLGASELERVREILVVREDGRMVGVVALEVYDDAATLRSLAVLPEHRSHGLGWMLADQAVARARELGVRRLYLLTESASDFFGEKLGFRTIDRSTVDPAVEASPHFRESARSAVAMRLDL